MNCSNFGRVILESITWWDYINGLDIPKLRHIDFGESSFSVAVEIQGKSI